MSATNWSIQNPSGEVTWVQLKSSCEQRGCEISVKYLKTIRQTAVKSDKDIRGLQRIDPDDSGDPSTFLNHYQHVIVSTRPTSITTTKRVQGVSVVI